MKGMKRFVLELPGVSPFKGDDFFKHYDLEVNAYYRIDDKKPKRTWTGSGQERICALCDRKKPEVTFNSESHTLPAGLGNNKYFSNEECDSCNDMYSEEMEGALASMLGFYRTIKGVRGRKKGGQGSKRNERKIHTPIMKLKDEGEIYFDEVDQTVKMIISENGEYKLEKGTKSLKVKVPVPKYKPGKAFVSLFKSIWLLMKEDQRAKNSLFKEFLTGKKDAEEFAFYSIFVPGTGHPIVELNLFRRKDPNGSTPLHVMSFSFLNHVLIWTSSDSRLPVFPPLDFFEGNLKDSKITMRQYTLPNLDHEFGGKDEEHEFGFNHLVEGKPNEIESMAQKRPRQEFIAPNAIVTAKFNETEIQCRIRIERFDNECFSFRLSGGQLGAELFFEEFKKYDKLNTAFTVALTSVEIKDAIKTIEFLIQTSTSHGNLVLIGLDGNNKFFEAHDFNINIDPEILNKWLNLAKLIDAINDEYGFELRYPPKISDDELHDLRLIGNGILRGRFRETQDEEGAINVSATREWVQFMLAAYDKDELPIFVAKRNFNFLDKSVGPIEVKVVPMNPRFEPGIEELREFASASGNKDDVIELAVITKSVIYEFSDWYTSSG